MRDRDGRVPAGSGDRTATPPRAQVRHVDAVPFRDLLAGFDDRDHQVADPYLEAITTLRGEELERVAVEADAEVIAVAAVRIRRLPLFGGVALVAGGPLVALPSCTDPSERHRLALIALSDVYAAQGIRVHFRAPVLPAFDGWLDRDPPGFEPSPLFDRYDTMVLSLTAGDEQRRAALSGHWRRNLRHSEQAGLVVDEPAVGATWQRMRPLYCRMHERKVFDAGLPLKFWDAVFAHPRADESFHGLVVHHEGHDVAATIVGGDGAVATQLLAASADAALPLRAGYLATWAAIDQAARRGHRVFDLGGVNREANPGGWQFKHGVRGQELSTPLPQVAQPGGPRGRLIQLAERSARRHGHIS